MKMQSSIKFVSYAQKCPAVLCTFAVALRKESVDRNANIVLNELDQYVALRKESVDRNIDEVDEDAEPARRSPQGERG